MLLICSTTFNIKDKKRAFYLLTHAEANAVKVSKTHNEAIEFQEVKNIQVSELQCSCCQKDFGLPLPY